MIKNKKINYLKLAIQHNLKYIKIKPHMTNKVLTKNYALYVYRNKITLNKNLLHKLLNV